jgi:hypothetical protein
MIPISRLKAELSSNGFENELYAVYVSPAAVTTQRQRLTALLDSFASLFGAQREVELFSAPGRTEVGGNHTDHNHGRVLAAGINSTPLLPFRAQATTVCACNPKDSPWTAPDSTAWTVAA